LQISVHWTRGSLSVVHAHVKQARKTIASKMSILR